MTSLGAQCTRLALYSESVAVYGLEDTHIALHAIKARVARLAKLIDSYRSKKPIFSR